MTVSEDLLRLTKVVSAGTGFSKGDKVILKYDDDMYNQAIVRQVSTVVEPPKGGLPFWMIVEKDGHTYNVRGSDCKKA